MSYCYVRQYVIRMLMLDALASSIHAAAGHIGNWSISKQLAAIPLIYIHLRLVQLAEGATLG